MRTPHDSLIVPLLYERPETPVLELDELTWACITSVFLNEDPDTILSTRLRHQNARTIYNHCLRAAVITGNTVRARNAIHKGADINWRFPSEQADQRPRFQLIESRDGPVRLHVPEMCGTGTILEEACNSSNGDMVSLILLPQRRLNISPETLEDAAASFVRCLDHIGVDCACPCPTLRLLIQNTDSSQMQKFLNRQLHRACFYNKLQVTKMALDLGADVDSYSCFYVDALEIASRFRADVSLVKLLLQRGASQFQGIYFHVFHIAAEE
jgi:hypothetical protein